VKQKVKEAEEDDLVLTTLGRGRQNAEGVEKSAIGKAQWRGGYQHVTTWDLTYSSEGGEESVLECISSFKYVADTGVLE